MFPHLNNKPSVHFLNEARFSDLSHPNISSIVSVEEDIVCQDSNEQNIHTSSITYEYLPNGTLHDLMSNGEDDSMDETLTRTLFHQLIEGLSYLHSKKVAHLDIKPENIMFSEDLTLKIIDFDLSKRVDESEIIHSQGTLNYRAPELTEKQTIVEDAFKCDVYSAGIILFLMRSGGILPFNEVEEDRFAAELKRMLSEEPSKFWGKHALIQHRLKTHWSKDF
mmetsp:Transcript_8313/g.7393  ORF Transcript_8313/g.7393 Transcript_8313/m.7393 type:complete len:222 (+) Transcript_8313:208-873(+)